MSQNRVFTSYSSLDRVDRLGLSDTVVMPLKDQKLFLRVANGSQGYYLNNDEGSNSYIFMALGIEDKYDFFRLNGLTALSGDFPELRTLLDLTTITKKLFILAEGIENFSQPNINFSDSFLQFLIDGKDRSRICKILYENINKLSTSKINYITNRYDEFLSYMPAKKIQEFNEDGSWKEKNRQKGKPAKIIKQLFTEELLELVEDSDFEIFSNLYKSINEKQGRFLIVKGQGIKDWYLEDRYKEGQGTLNNSCMRYKLCNDYFGIYTENSDVVSMLILIDENDKLLGRAILWNVPGGVKIMDRVYGLESTLEKFISWAFDNDYYIKSKNNNSTSSYFINKINDIIDDVKIYMNNLQMEKYPYLDTFSYMDANKTFLTNGSSYDCRYELRSTNGRFTDHDDDDEDYDDDERTCAISGRVIYTDDNAIYINRMGDYVHQDYAVYCHHLEEDILLDDAIECELSGEFYHRDYMVELVDGRQAYVHNPNILTLQNLEYCHIDDSFVCEYDGCIYHKDERTSIVIDGSEHFVYVNNLEEFKNRFQESN